MRSAARGWSAGAWPALAGAVDHPGADGDAGGFIDEDEGAGGAVLGVGVAQQRNGGAQLDAADLVEPELLGLLVAVQAVDVEAVLEILDQRATTAGGVLDRELLAWSQRLVGHPADHRVDVLARPGSVLRAGYHVAAGDVDVVGQPDRHRHRRGRPPRLPGRQGAPRAGAGA